MIPYDLDKLPESMQEKFEKDIQREIKVMTKINGHKNIVQLYEILEDAEPPMICLVMEYCKGDLFDLIEKNMKEDEVMVYFSQIVNAVE